MIQNTLIKKFKFNLYIKILMYKIKQRPEDFIVEEIIELDSKPGPYFYIKLTKKQWNTLDVVKILQERLPTRSSRIETRSS